MQAPKANEVIDIKFMLKTRPPISVILLGLIDLRILIEVISSPAWIIYLIPLNIIYYLMFCRYCCTISVNGQVIEVKYLNPWKEKVKIEIADVVSIEYRKGYYDLFSGHNSRFLSQYCYDRLLVHFKDPEKCATMVHVNTFAFGLDKVFKLLASHNKKITAYTMPFL